MKKSKRGNKFDQFLSNIINNIKKNKALLLLFCFATTFFIIQHLSGVSWDFSVYVLNAKYLFSNGFYFEWLRPPLAPFLIGILSIFGWLTAEYLYIILVSFLCLIGTIKLSEKLKINKIAFYALMLTPFVLNMGLSVGTELLSFALLELCIAFIISKKPISGLFLGLAALTNYTNFIFLPLLLFNKEIKKIVLSFSYFILPLLPWFLFNYVLTGSILTSIIDSYTLNVYLKNSLFTFFKFGHLLTVANYYILFAALGLIFVAKKKEMKREAWLMIAFLILVLVENIKIPAKEARYLFAIILPLTYFSCLFFENLKNKEIARKMIIAVVIANIVFSFVFFVPLDDTSYFNQVLPKMDRCMLSSNVWVYYNYFGRPVEPLPLEKRVNESINQGYRILIFKWIKDPSYTSNKSLIEQLPAIEETREYILLGRGELCKEEHAVDMTSIQRSRIDRKIEIKECDVLFSKVPFQPALCKLFGFH